MVGLTKYLQQDGWQLLLDLTLPVTPAQAAPVPADQLLPACPHSLKQNDQGMPDGTPPLASLAQLASHCEDHPGFGKSRIDGELRQIQVESI